MKKQTKKIANKKITIDKLAEMVQRGFMDQAERFDNKLQNFATKDDLRNFATKDDLRNFATKDDLRNFATKDDLKKLESNFKNLEDQVKNLEDQVLTGFDKVLGKLDKMDQESIVHDYKHKRIDDVLEIHDAKIKKLETKK